MARAKRPDNDPALFTREEMRDKLLTKFSTILDYWLDESRAETVEDRMEGMMHSVLSTLDGSAADMPGFLLIPNVTPADDKYHRQNGEKHAPPITDDTTIGDAIDVGGVLHELWHRVRDKERLSPKLFGSVPLRKMDGKQELHPTSQPNEIDSTWNGG